MTIGGVKQKTKLMILHDVTPWKACQAMLHRGCACCGDVQGALHGVITTLRYTFVLKRLHVDSLQFAITRGYRNTQTNPSMPQVLFCKFGPS